jgi:hypothetical protein
MKGLFGFCARMVAAMGAVVAMAASAQSVTVVEYYNRALDAYFITGRVGEQAILDGIADFQRTGMTFQAVAIATAPTNFAKICRFYVSAVNPYTSSHFYGRQGPDCEGIRDQRLPAFTWEDYDFAVQPTGGACAAPIYRSFRAAANGKTPNHRYSAGLADYLALAQSGKGFVGEDVAFCATASTPVSVMPPPPSSSAECGTFYFPDRRVTYQSTSSQGGTTSTFVRTYDPVPVLFNGQSATQIVDTPTTGSPSSTMISDGVSSWSELGGRSIGSSGVQETYFSPPIIFPKSMTIGQSINIARAVTFSPASPNGNGNQTGSIVLTARESVTAPAGTYANACKFTINTVTTYPLVGSTSDTRTVVWVAPGVGMVRSDITDTTAVMGFSVTSTSTVLATAVQ